jgi:SagB-type dehydrogenase family enzyme
MLKHLLSIPAILLFVFACNSPETNPTAEISMLEILPSDTLIYQLPNPKLVGTVSVEEAMFNRRSRRNYIDAALSVEQVTQILWAAYGITYPSEEYDFLRGGFRTAPSAGALYPLDVYLVVGKIDGINKGVYKYRSSKNQLIRVLDRDVRSELAEAALNQEMIAEAPASIFYSAIFERSTKKYGERARERYVCMDLGHSAQNVYLQVEALKLGTCAIGAFNDEKVSQLLQLPAEEEPLYMMPIGYYFKEESLK